MNLILCTLFPAQSLGLEFYWQAFRLLGYRLPPYAELPRSALGRPYLKEAYLPVVVTKSSTKALAQPQEDLSQEAKEQQAALQALALRLLPELKSEERELVIKTLLTLHQDYYLLDFNLSNNEEALAVAWVFGKQSKPQILVGLDLETKATFLPSAALFKSRILAPQDFYYPLALRYAEESKKEVTPEEQPSPSLENTVSSQALLQQLIKIWVSKEALVKAYASSIMRAKDLLYCQEELLNGRLFVSNNQLPLLQEERKLLNFTLTLDSQLELALALFMRQEFKTLLVQQLGGKKSLFLSSEDPSSEANPPVSSESSSTSELSLLESYQSLAVKTLRVKV